MTPTTSPYGACHWRTTKERQDALRDFLRTYGDGIPKDAIEKAVEPKALIRWVERCLRSEPNHLVSAVRYEHTDWYACTVKNLATERGHRGKNLGTEVVSEAIDRADAEPDCHVLFADITSDNGPSLKVFKDKLSKAHKFTELEEQFCFEGGKPPSNMLTLVRFKPGKDGKCHRRTPSPNGGMKSA